MRRYFNVEAADSGSVIGTGELHKAGASFPRIEDERLHSAIVSEAYYADELPAWFALDGASFLISEAHQADFPRYRRETTRRRKIEPV